MEADFVSEFLKLDPDVQSGLKILHTHKDRAIRGIRGRWVNNNPIAFAYGLHGLRLSYDQLGKFSYLEHVALVSFGWNEEIYEKTYAWLMGEGIDRNNGWRSLEKLLEDRIAFLLWIFSQEKLPNPAK